MLTNEKYKEVAGEVVRVAAKERAAALPANFVNDYAERDSSYASKTSMWAPAMPQAALSADGKTATITDFFAHGLSISGTVSGNTITFAPQSVYNSEENGNLLFCHFDPTRGGYSSKQGVVATINDDGTIQFEPWAMIYTSGGYVISNSKMSSVSSGSLLHPANATMHNVVALQTDSTEDYSVYIDQQYDNTIEIVNFLNSGVSITAYINTDSTVEITPQRLYSIAGYGDFLCYPADYSSGTGRRLNGSIIANATPTTIELGQWGIFGRTISQLNPYAYSSSTINITNGKLRFPVKKEIVWDGEGTQASPYIINNVQKLIDFEEDVNSGNNYEGKYIRLDADLNMSSASTAFRPIGHSSGASFLGNFDGNNHKISHLTITTGQQTNSGLFGYAGKGSIIKNLNVDSVTVESYGDNLGTIVGQSLGSLQNLHVSNGTFTHHASFGGGIVGWLDGGSLDNASFQGTVSGYGATGGIVGYMHGGSVSNTHADASMRFMGYMQWFYRSLGGIVGYALSDNNGRSHISDSYFEGSASDIDGQGQIGGIVGNSNGGIIERCFNVAPLTTVATSSSNGMAGGIVGNISNSTVSNSYNAAQVTSTRATNEVGGIVGYIISPSVSSSKMVEFINCYSSGQVILSSPTNRQGLYGVSLSNPIEVFQNTFYDKQITGNEVIDSLSQFAKTTAEITSGSLAGFDASVWTQTKGQYPVLKEFASTKASMLSAAPLKLYGDESLLKVKNTFTADTQNGINWYVLTSSSEVTKNGTYLQIDGDSVKLKSTGTEDIIATYDNGNISHIKMYEVNTVNPQGFVGKGTEAEPYLITTKEDLITLNKSVTSGQSFTGDYFKQTGDIWLNNATDFTGVGNDMNQNHTFDGTYDGGGFSIHQLLINNISYNSSKEPKRSGSRSVAGFFGYCNKNSVIKNLTIASDCKIVAYDIAGGVAAVTLGRIENCRNYADVTAMNEYAGGITGQLVTGGVITDCYNSGHIVTGSSYAAGIASTVGGNISYCQNDGEVAAEVLISSKAETAVSSAGGIVSQLGGQGSLTGNINTGYVHSYRDVGGIAAVIYGGDNSMQQNLNYGTVISTSGTRVGTISASSSSPTHSANNIYDKQIAQVHARNTFDDEGFIPVTTKSLTSGDPISGFTASKYDFSKGLYPVLAAFKNENAAIANRQIIVTLAGDETANNVRSNASVNTSYQLKWNLAKNSFYKLNGNTLTVTIGKGDASLRDTLTATLTDDHKNVYTKIIPLRSVPLLFEGAGTESDPYRIRTLADLQTLSSFSNNDKYDFNGSHFLQENDIDMKDSIFMPIAFNDVYFNAEYNGANHKLTNINIDLDNDDYAGLFSTVGQQGFIHNLTIASGTINGYRNVGGFIGKLAGRADSLVFAAKVVTPKFQYTAGIADQVAETGIITNSVNRGTLSPAGGQGGGIATLNNGRISHCVNEASQNNTGIGGIANSNYGIIEYCDNHGTITGSSGVAGIARSNSGIVSNCTNDGAITAEQYSVAGGIVGSQNNGSILNCINTADINGVEDVGGIAGSTQNAFTIKNVTNKGTVIASKESVGGIVGDIYSNNGDNEAVLSNAVNYGEVIASNRYAGGIAGEMGNFILIDSTYNLGNVSCDGGIVGGIVGYSRSSTITNSWNAADISGDNEVGGIGGSCTADINNVANVGNITATGNNGIAGGLVGSGSSDIINAYNMGTVNAKQYAGGILGDVNSTSVTIKNVYQAGKVIGTSSTGAVVSPSGRYTPTITNVYYASDTCSVSPSDRDASANAITTAELYDTQALGDAFIYSNASYPVLKTLASDPLLNYYAASLRFAAGDNANSITNKFSIGIADSTAWSSSANVTIYGNTVGGQQGSGWIEKATTVYGKNLSHRYPLVFKSSVTGIDTIEDASANGVVRSEYYDISGKKISNPIHGQVYIVRQMMNDGTVKTVKQEAK